MPRTVQGLWVGEALSFIEVLSIRSFLHHGHDFHLYVYDPVRNVPDGTTVKDANAILPKDRIYRSDGGGLGSYSDFFRWSLLKAVGGIWVDLDMVCLRPFDFTDEIVFGYEAPDRINGAVLGFPAGHPMTAGMAKACDDVNLFQPIDTTKTVVKKILRKAIFGKDRSRVYTRHGEPGGAAYLDKFVRYYELTPYAKPAHWFYPIHWSRRADIFRPSPDAEKAIEGSYGVHLWNEILRRDPTMDKDNLNFDGTLIGKLRDRYM